MANTAKILVKWIRLSSFLSLLLGMLGILYMAYTPYFWYKGVMGIVGVATGSVGLFATFKGSESWAKLYHGFLIGFMLAVGLGNVGVFLVTKNDISQFCTPTSTSTTDTSLDCNSLNNESFISIFLIAIIIFVFGPLCFISKKYIKALQIEGPIEPDSHAEVLVSS